MTELLEISASVRAFAESSGIRPASVAPAEVQSIAVGGLALSLIDWGGPATSPVLFLHGGGLTAHTWDLVCLALRGSHHCLALDLRGHGDSDQAPDADDCLEAFATGVAAVIQRIGQIPPIVMGQSLGGQAALLAIGEAAPARGLGLIDVGPEPDPWGMQRIIRWIDAPAEFTDLDSAVAAAMTMNPRRDPTVLRESLLNNLQELPSGGWTWKYDSRAFAGLTGPVLGRRAKILWSAVERVRVPVLLVRGAQSQVFSDRQVRALSDRLPDCQIALVPNAGHTIQSDNPAGLIAALQPWLVHCAQTYAAGD